MDNTSTEEALWARATGGDQTAWDSIIRGYANLVFKAALSTGLSRPDAEDVLQATFIKLVTNADQIKDPTAVKSWLVTTARREAWRLRGEVREFPLLADVSADIGSLPSDDSVAAAFDKEATAAEVRRIMGRLASSKDETAFKVLTFILDELEKGGSYPSQRAIGEAVGISHAAVAKALNRIKPQFRDAYSGTRD